MLYETGLPFSEEFVERQSNGELDASYLAINPNGTVPAIIDTETNITLFESGAILFYLAEKTGKLLPADLNARAEVMKWLMFEAANVSPVMSEVHHYLLADNGENGDVILSRYKNKLALYCEMLNRQLDGRMFLCGDFSIADIAVYPWAAILEDMADIKPGDFPYLDAWVKFIAGRIAGG